MNLQRSNETISYNDIMKDLDTNGFSNVFDEHIRSISKQVIEEEFAKRQICEDSVIVDPEAIKLQRCLQRIMSKEFLCQRSRCTTQLFRTSHSQSCRQRSPANR